VPSLRADGYTIAVAPPGNINVGNQQINLWVAFQNPDCLIAVFSLNDLKSGSRKAVRHDKAQIRFILN